MERELTENVIEEIAEKNSEPSWMKEKRLESWHVFKIMPMPTGQEETWRRTDFNRFRIIETLPYMDPVLQTQDHNNLKYGIRPSILSYKDTSGILIQRNSHMVFNTLADDLRRKGVIYTDIITAIQKHPDLMKSYLMTDCIKPDNSKFTAIHSACMNGGVFLYIPEGVEVHLPIRALFSMKTNGDGMFYHTLIIAGAYSKVTYIEECSSNSNDNQSISNNVVEVFLNEGATVNYLGLQDLSTDVYHFATKRAIVNRDASMNWIEGSKGSKLTKSYLESILKESGANTGIFGTFSGTNDQHIDISTFIHHLAPDTTADLLINCALKDRARSVFQGMIKIEKKAQKTDSYMANHNLILGDKARADSIPRLEIEADDVHATHGVSIGQIDEEQLFYLMSRGISPKDSKDMIVNGLFEAVLRKVKTDDVKKTLRDFIKGKKYHDND